MFNQSGRARPRGLVVLAAGCALGLAGAPAASAAPPFAADSVWNAPLAANAPTAVNSGALSQELRRQIAQYGPWLNTTSYSTPVYTVGASQAKVKVIADTPYASTLQAGFNAVPLPPDARPADGTDAHLVVYQPSSDTLWEFWRLSRRSDGWHAAWGGTMTGVSRNPGYFTGTAGATATGLPLLGGLIRTTELAGGKIDHALSIGLPDVKQGSVVWPAQRGDGASSAANAIPEGTRFRINANVDIDALHLAPAAATLARAAQRYGLIVSDRAGAVVLYGEDPSPWGLDPWPGLLGDWANKVLLSLPWDKVEAVVPDRSALASGGVVDSSPAARLVTTAGTAPVAATGVFGGALAFTAGRLLVPQFALPLRHRMGAWIKPTAGHGGDQFVMGQWKSGATPGDGAPIAALVYDGTNRRVIYYVIDATGRFVGAATPNGSYDPNRAGLHLIEGGIRNSGELIVGIDGAFYSYGQFAGSLDSGDGATPFSVGDVSNGGQPFEGTIDSPFVTATAAPDGDYPAPSSAPTATSSTLLLLPLDL